jgi:hypothetical protein
MKYCRKDSDQSRIGIMLLALIFVSLGSVPVSAADDLPKYVESITPGTSVDVVFSSTGGEPQVNTYNSPSTTGADVVRTHSDAYYNYYKAIYTTPGFVGAPQIGKYTSRTDGYSQYTIANYHLQGIQSNGGSVGIHDAGDLIASKKTLTSRIFG